jgi:hypothetical protein
MATFVVVIKFLVYLNLNLKVMKILVSKPQLFIAQNVAIHCGTHSNQKTN